MGRRRVGVGVWAMMGVAAEGLERTGIVGFRGGGWVCESDTVRCDA